MNKIAQNAVFEEVTSSKVGIKMEIVKDVKSKIAKQVIEECLTGMKNVVLRKLVRTIGILIIFTFVLIQLIMFIIY